MISKELLSEILKIEDILEYRQSVNILWVTDAKSHCGALSYNVYELAHKCKEWAYNYGKGNPSKYPFYIWTGIDHNGKWNAFATEFKSFCQFTQCIEQNVLPYISEKTEPEAIFKACGYILNNKENNERD